MSISQAIAAIGTYLQPYMPAGTKIVRGQGNNVPAPLPPSIVLTPIGLPQYTTTRKRYDDDGQAMSYVMPKRLEIQADFYGVAGGDMSNIAATLLRSIDTIGKFPDGITPLYCTDARQFPLTTGEKQYEDRWNCTIALQYTEAISIIHDSFDEVGEVDSIPVNVVYPVE